MVGQAKSTPWSSTRDDFKRREQPDTERGLDPKTIENDSGQAAVSEDVA